jgi:hypothetical protein
LFIRDKIEVIRCALKSCIRICYSVFAQLKLRTTYRLKSKITILTKSCAQLELCKKIITYSDAARQGAFFELYLIPDK